MDLLLQRVLDGLSDGAVYALFALAVVLVFRTTGFINFAQGEMGMICAFIAWKLFDPNLGFGLPLVLAIGVGILSGFVLGAVTERVVIRPFEGGDHLRLGIVSMGLLLIFNSVAAFIFGTTTQRIPSIFGNESVRIGNATIGVDTLGQFVVLGVAALLLWLLFTRTTLGVTLRASSQNPDSSQLLGIDVRRNLLVGWGLAGLLGATAAIMIAPSLFVSPNLMGNVMLYGFVAAVVGGLDSSVGAVVGGLGVGLVQSLSSGYIDFIGTQLQLASALVVVVAILIIRPQGLFGRARLERV